MRRLSSVVAFVAASSLPVVAFVAPRALAEDAPATSAAPVDLQNATCPVKGTPAKAEVTETWNGMKVHFCCAHCAAKFKADPAKYESALRADPVVAKKMDAVEAAAAPGGAVPGGTGALDAAVAGWPAPVRTEVVLLGKKYGEPKETLADRIVWEDATPWTTTIVHKSGDAVEQTLSHRLEGDAAERLASFRHVKVDAEKGVLTFRHSSEALNFAAANLANEIATGKVTVTQADARFAEIEKNLKNGKTPAETQRLAFEPMAEAADPAEKPAPDAPADDDMGR